jgi:N-acetylmuramoyl-L-alanine amidase
MWIVVKIRGKIILTLLILFTLIISPIFTQIAYANGYFYTVKSGDTLWKIAQRNGTTVYRIKKENNYWSNTIYPGQKFYISTKRKFSDYDRYLMAKAIHAEARGEPFEGQVAIGGVILNRVRSDKFPNTVHGVIYQPYAFTAVIDGQIYLEPNSTAYKAADLAIKGWDPSEGALFYFNPKTATSKWIWTRPQIKKIGNHIFAK